MKTPETDNLARGNHVVPTEWAEQLERERDEAREENKKFREALEWIAERYDDFKPLHSVAMDAYEMSCIAKSALQIGGIMSERPTPETDAVAEKINFGVDIDFARKLERERDEARAVAKLAYSILAKVNRRSLEDAAARSSIKHINNTPMEWLYSIIQNWEATQ